MLKIRQTLMSVFLPYRKVYNSFPRVFFENQAGGAAKIAGKLSPSPAKAIFLLIVFVTIFAAGCDRNLKLYVNYADRIKLKYPMDWIVQEEAMGAAVTFLSPQEGADDQFQDNLSIIVQDLGDQKVTLKEYSAAVSNEISQLIPGVQTSEIMDLNISGSPAQKMVSAAQINGMKLKMVQVWTIKDKKTYMITFTAQEEKYSKYEKIVEKILRSFKII